MILLLLLLTVPSGPPLARHAVATVTLRRKTATVRLRPQPRAEVTT